jgi:hypothetical protein
MQLVLTAPNYDALRLFSAGAVFTKDYPERGAEEALASQTDGRTFQAYFTDQYYIFQFETGGLIQQGWLEASLAAGPDLTVIAYAYDSSGALLPAGDTGISPEPSSLSEGALETLVLDAAGLRRWRKARGIATQQAATVAQDAFDA